MMIEFAFHISQRTNRPYNAEKNRIRLVTDSLILESSHLMSCSCLAHIVNLATQALLSSYSTSKHYDPKNPNDHLPPATASADSPRDVVGLVRAITVKVHNLSSFVHRAYRNARSAPLPNANSSSKMSRNGVASPSPGNSSLICRSGGHPPISC